MSALGLLVHRLIESGVQPERIPRLMRDALDLLAEGGFFTPELVNDHLERRGWAAEILDEESFFLIVTILESEWGYRVRHYRLSGAVPEPPISSKTALQS
jgi:hypothetical protein